MLSTHDDVDIWSAHPDFPDEPQFYRAVIDGLPTPVLVIDDEGLVVYGNRAMIEMAGRTKDEGVQTSVFDYVHPEDLETIALAFASIDVGVASPDHQWPSIRCRMVHSDGSEIPVRVTGRECLEDGDVGAVIYHVAPAHEAALFEAAFRTVVSGNDVESFQLVFELARYAHVDISFAVMLDGVGDTAARIFCDRRDLSGVLAAGLAAGEMAWTATGGAAPQRVPTESLPGEFGLNLRSLGMSEAWVVEVPTSPLLPRAVVLAFSPDRSPAPLGQRDCVARASQLAAVLLLRAHASR